VLEIGAGHGAYTALLRWAGFDATALDLSSWTARFARERFDIPYLVGPVSEQALEPESYDVVVANDVLEHLSDPLGTVRGWVALLKPRGIFVFQTPEFPLGRSHADLVEDGDLFLQHIERAASEHLYLFSRPAVERLLGQVGLKHVIYEEPVYSYDMIGVAAASLLARDGNMDPAAALQDVGPTSALAAALVDARRAWRTSERDRAARLVVIERLDAALRSAQRVERE
jgi:SAM-dependent methyltransferase